MPTLLIFSDLKIKFMQEEKSFELGGEQNISKKLFVGDKEINFYKLDKSKKYKVEGDDSRAAVTVLIIISAIIDSFTLIFCIAGYGELFRTAEGTVVPLFFIAFGIVFTVVSAVSYRKSKRERARIKAILRDCTLTDGTVTDCCTEKIVTGHGSSRSTSYKVDTSYSFYGLDGNIRSGLLSATYSSDPEFYEGQNLMVAFNDGDSVILSKFVLSEGAGEFARAEEERMELDFDGLSGKLLNVDTSRPIKTLAYSRVCVIAGASVAGLWLVSILPVFIISLVDGWGLLGTLLPPCITALFFLLPAAYIGVSGLKHVLNLKKILKNPSFTKGIMFFRKTTYRGGPRAVFYRYKDADGGRHIERFKGIGALKITDGLSVVVAYSGGKSEIISEYTLKRGAKRDRVR